MEPGAARRLWRVVRAVLYVLHRGLPSGRKFAMDLHHLLLRRGKIAGKALSDLLTFHHHRHAVVGGGGSFLCRALDPGLAVHEPSRRSREVEFSCSNTPSAAGGGLHLLGAARRHRRSGRRHHRDETSSSYLHYYNYDAADVARLFEMLNDDGDDEPAPAAATPSPAQLLWAFARSPAVSRQLRITDSPFQPAAARVDADDAQVDRQADEFIRRFYEQLRAQKSAASTPDYYGYAAPSPYTSGRTPPPIAAGIA